MRIGIDARFYGPIGKGLGRYTAKLIEHLAEIPDAHTYRIYLRDENLDAFQPPDQRFEKVRAPYTWYSLEEQLVFPKLLNRDHLDLMHFPHFNVPMWYRRPFLVTIHDLILTRYPTVRATTLGPLKYFIKRNAYQIVIRSALKRARHIITVSHYSKRQILEHFPSLPDSKISVTYEGVDAFTQVPLRLHRKGQLPYFLYVGNAYPHKNLERLLEAFSLFLKQGHRAQLILVGKRDHFYARLENIAADFGIQKHIRFAGYVPDNDLAQLYAGATAYIIPSLEEGFGLPPLEAMQYHVPVIAARASCLPEILGDGAEYVDPHDAQAIANAMQCILIDSELRTQLIRNAQSNVLPRFSWKKMAEETHAIYEQTS